MLGRSTTLDNNSNQIALLCSSNVALRAAASPKAAPRDTPTYTIRRPIVGLTRCISRLAGYGVRRFIPAHSVPC